YARELADEMHFHMTLDAEHDQQGGLSAADARDAARRRFGNVTYIKEETRRQAGLTFFDDVAQDLRYALRACRCAPGFTLAATLTLALGIGATTAVFSIVDGVLVRGLPYRDADRVVDLWETSDNGGYLLPSHPKLKEWRSQSVARDRPLERVAFVKGAGAIFVS